MFRVCRMTNKWYAVNIGDEIDDEAKEDIEAFVGEGTPIIVVDELCEMEEFDVSEDEITIVVKE